MATVAYLDVDQGSDFIVEIELENDNGTPMVIIDWEVYSQFRKSYGSTIAYQFDAQIIDGYNGKIQLALPGVVSSTIKPGRYLYDIELFDPVTNRKTRAIEGIVTINPEITRIP